MPFELSDEQRTFRDSLRKFFESEAPLAALRARSIDNGAATDAALWKKCGDFGLPASFAAAPSEGGVGARELIVGAVEEGRALFPVAVAERLLCLHVLTSVADPAQRAAALAAAGESGLEDGSRFGCTTLGRNAAGAGGFEVRTPKKSSDTVAEVKLSGEAPFVCGADGAAFLLFAHGTALGIAALSGDGVSVSALPALDLSRRACVVKFQNARAVLLADAAPYALDMAGLVQAAQVSGVADRAVALTVEYTRQRKQFDVPVGGFQAVQQQLAAAYLESESLAALVEFAGWAAAESAEQRELSARSALLQACSKGAAIVETAVQLHGGIGFTWEHDLHLFLRRAKFIEALYAPDDSGLGRVLAAASATLRTQP